jgi:predicted permease
MDDLLTLLPVLVGLVAGYVLRRVGLVDQRDGESVFKLVFYLFTPAVMFSSLAVAELELRFAIYPAAAIVMIGAGYAAARVMAAKARLDPVRTAVAVSGCMVVNTGFQLPFVQVLYGAEGVARLAAFDIVNGVATFTLAYLVAVRGNPARDGSRLPLGRLARNPALYAIAAGLLVNVAGVTVPDVIGDPIEAVGAVTPILIPIGIGILFNPIGNGIQTAALMVATRLITGLAVATAAVLLLGVGGIDRTVLLLLGAAPVVFAGVAFASTENLDVRLATTALSMSLVVSVVISLLTILISA